MVAGRAYGIIKGKSKASSMNWGEVLAAGKHKEFYEQIKPGDVLLSGVVTHNSFKDVYRDLHLLGRAKLAKKLYERELKKMGLKAEEIADKTLKTQEKLQAQKKVTEQFNKWKLDKPQGKMGIYPEVDNAKARIDELVNKIGLGGQFDHAALCIGKLDDAFLKDLKSKTTPQRS